MRPFAIQAKSVHALIEGYDERFVYMEMLRIIMIILIVRHVNTNYNIIMYGIIYFRFRSA